MPEACVGVFFGGQSPEHEVSIISAAQAMAAADPERWEIVPVYIAKDGSWWTGDSLRDLETFKGELGAKANRVRLQPGVPGRMRLVAEQRGWRRRDHTVDLDLVFPVLHGGAGEDGGLQGACEVAGVAYAGCGVLASALAMDKVAAKHWASAHGLPVVPSVAVREADWAGRESAVLDHVEGAVGLPAVVKPARLGSSIGITRVETRAELDNAIEEAFRYDGKIIVEHAVPNLRELNCSVLAGPGGPEASVLEQPVGGELLSFRDKYLSDGSGKGGTKQQRAQGMAALDRKIPAPVSEALTQSVRDLAVRTFRAFDCAGVVRIDFLMDDESGKVYLNEINTIPGSLSFYLWEPSGVPFPALIDRLLEGARSRHLDRTARVRTYAVNLLSEKDLGGLKGSKG